jgi:hypothetical protein
MLELNKGKMNLSCIDNNLQSKFSTPGTATGTDGLTPRSCPRIDTGTLFQASLQWSLNQFQRVSGQVQLVDNKNPQQKEFNESTMSFEFAVTMAFPSVKRVTRFVDRYADNAFTKEAE